MSGYWAKGSNQATFSLEWQKLVDEVTACHAIANGVAARGKNNLFKSLCVFAFRTARELVGKKQRSFACRVIDHEVPNLQNWRNYFVGFDSTLKHQVWEEVTADHASDDSGNEYRNSGTTWSD